MPKFEEHLLKEEVEELTEMLRSDEAFDNVRDCLAKQEFAVNDVLLAGWIESEDGWQGGAIVHMNTKHIYLFEINDWRTSTSFDKWDKVQSIKSAVAEYPAVEVAVSLCSG